METVFVEVRQQPRTAEKRWALGVLCIVSVAVIWAGASVLVQFIFEKESFRRPFFLTYLCNSLFAINLPIWYVGLRMGYVSDVPTGLSAVFDYVNIRNGTVYTKVEIARTSALICPLWFLANWSYNESLAMTSVTSSTVISNTSTLWTFVLSICVLGEGFSWWKVGGVLLCLGGNVLTTFGDSTRSNAAETAWGDVVCMFSAFMYGVYTVCIRWKIPDESAVSLPLFFGFLGLINMIMLAPVVIALNYTGVETLYSVTAETIGLIVAKGILDNVVSDYLWALGVLLTTPTVATIGLSLTIPLAIISDLFLNAILPTVSSIGAAILVVAGFLAINLASSNDGTDAPANDAGDRGSPRTAV
eukprot:jgi/Bigna1/55457/estExt_Genewise1Plus.C_600053